MYGYSYQLSLVKIQNNTKVDDSRIVLQEASNCIRWLICMACYPDNIILGMLPTGNTVLSTRATWSLILAPLPFQVSLTHIPLCYWLNPPLNWFSASDPCKSSLRISISLIPLLLFYFNLLLSLPSLEPPYYSIHTCRNVSPMPIFWLSTVVPLRLD